MRLKNPLYFSLDLETTGVVPGRHAIVEIGVAALLESRQYFGRLVIPFVGAEVDPEAMAVHEIEPVEIERCGTTPYEATRQLYDFVNEAAGGRDAVCVGWNVAFDWSFLTWYLGRYNFENPFHHAPVDVKALACGALGVPWEELSGQKIRQTLGLVEKRVEHRALEDACDQADVFQALTRLGEGDAP